MKRANLQPLIWTVFSISCILQIVLFCSGVLRKYYNNELDSIAVFKGFGPFLLLVTGLIITLIITILFTLVRLSPILSVVLDLGSQISAYLCLLISIKYLLEIAGLAALVLVAVAIIAIWGNV